jgi:4-hydroxythreonine-4-phosphate dehydrogenase
VVTKSSLVAVTVGEPAGIGADLLIALLQMPQLIIPVVFADFRLLAARAACLGLPLKLHVWTGERALLPLGELYGVDIPQAGSLAPQTVDPLNAAQVLAALSEATYACMRGDVDMLITGPVNKAAINAAGTPFIGQTEWVAACCGVEAPVMMLAIPFGFQAATALPFRMLGRSCPTGTLAPLRAPCRNMKSFGYDKPFRVALVTTHMPLAQVPGAITASRLASVVKTVAHDLTRFWGIVQPRLAVCGLNPHAGEQGYLGTEEQNLINPCLEALRAEGINVTDAMPADTLLVPEMAKDYDAIIAMYHDQGLPVIKAQGFGSVVNITLGLPICRLSVDHGTALSLAGSGKASSDSLQTVFNLAAQLSSF